MSQFTVATVTASMITIVINTVMGKINILLVIAVRIYR